MHRINQRPSLSRELIHSRKIVVPLLWHTEDFPSLCPENEEAPKNYSNAQN